MSTKTPSRAYQRTFLRTLFAFSLLTFGALLAVKPAQATGAWWCKCEVKDDADPVPAWGVSDVMAGGYHVYPFPHDWGLLGGSAWSRVPTPTTTPVSANGWTSDLWDEDKDDTANVYFGDTTLEWWQSHYAIDDTTHTPGPGLVKFRFQWADQNDISVASPSDQPTSLSVSFESHMHTMCIISTTFSHTDEGSLSNYLLYRNSGGIHYFLDDGFGDAATSGYPYAPLGQFEAISKTDPNNLPTFTLTVPTSGTSAGKVEKDVYMQGYVSGNCGSDSACLSDGYSIHLQGGIAAYINP